MKLIRRIYNYCIYLLRSYIYNYLDYRTNRHIVVIESDDWGSIRMPGRLEWEELLKMGYAVDKRPYERYDTLESVDDLESLFSVLRKHRDSKGNHPVITANMLVANPDFEKILQSGFRKYYYESIDDTYKKYFGDTRVIDLMKIGIKEGLFMPQFHGREHFNVTQWMSGLQKADKDLLVSFKLGMCGIAPKSNPSIGNKMMNAMHAENEHDQEIINSIVLEGLRLFESFWGFKSESFVAPCYLWSAETEKILAKEGVQLIQTSRCSKPTYKSPVRFFYTGKRNSLGQIYSVRNCSFEPSTDTSEVTAKKLLSQVEQSFCQHKIAVISSHRINYVGGIDKANRTKTLDMLNEFLTLLLQKYPDVEFMSSDRLYKILNKK